ncbi:type II secretion system protein [Lysinibacillus sp. KU-BSD001]|uniref:prepilin-type N-terminal cleavage/methylation domain-containing protein n=1 Tax=Lysinibacillus sp. KU-BSD001 TaxID=3141328 RepID=UPI0036EB76FA
MFQQLKKRIKNEKGLTLVELLAVIVILGIIAAIAVPAIGNIIQNSRERAVLSEAINIISGAKIAHMNGDCTQANNTCDKAALTPYVEGVTLPDGTQVVYTPASGTTEAAWTITYSKLTSDIKSTSKYHVGSPVTEKVIKGKID